MPPIKVLHIIDKLSMDGKNPSSCTNLIADWISIHDSKKFQIDTAVLRAKDSVGISLEKRNIKVYYIDQFKFSPRIIYEISKIAAEEKYDILHLHGYRAANFGRLAARKMGIKTIVHEHAILKILPHQFSVDYLLSSLTDIGIAVSSAVKKFMIEGRSISADNIVVIPNGIKLENFQSTDNNSVVSHDFRSHFQIPENVPLIGTITRLREEKGNHYLINAASEVLKTFPEAYFAIIGDGPLKAELINQARTLAISDRIIFTDHLSPVIPALQAMDIAVIPSLTEGFSLSMVEAMASGKPIVATKVGGMVDLAEDQESALFVPPADSHSLSDAINTLLSNPELANRLAKNSRIRSRNYSLEKNVEALEQLYQDMLH